MIQVEDILDQEPISIQGGHEQFIDPLTNTLAYLHVFAWGRSGMSGHNHSHVRQALTCYDIALEIFDLTSVASRHAIVLQNKGNVLTRLGIWRGGAEGMRLLEQAIDCYDRALKVYDSRHMATEYATTQHNKGNALRSLAQFRDGDEAWKLLK